MKVLIVSDTHRKNDIYLNLIKLHKPDRVIHCGDAEGSEYLLTESADCPVYIVRGNNDFFSELPKELEMKVGKYKIWITHGHNYYVSMGNEILKQEAMARGVDIVCYGHTHRPVIDQSSGVIAINPGSLSYPRQENRRPSYVIMDIDEKGQVHFTMAYI